MDNLNNNTNPATQTLFRFVNLRNPQLANREGNPKFIFRPKDYIGVFDNLITGWTASGKSKIDFLTEKAKSADFNFGYIKRTEADIESWFGNFYISSKNLIANGSLPSEEVNELLNIINIYDQDVVKRKEVFVGLWDSIIYQVLTEEDFYIKELLTQILQVIHYAKNYNILSTESILRKKLAKQKEIATAKVVIPDSLFVDSVPVDGQANVFTVGSTAVGSGDYINGSNKLTANIYPATESMLKRQKVALATYEKEQLEELKKELIKTQTIYNKQYTKAYDLASKNYQTQIKPIYDAYEHQLLQVEATFTEEMTEAAKKLAFSQVAKPEIPDFEFEFRAERDVAFLQTKLSETSLKSFVNLIGEYVADDSIAGRLSSGDILPENIVAISEDQFILPADENQSFEEMLETIDEKLSALNEEIYQNTEVEKREYVSVGGILVPVNNSVPTPYSYSLLAHSFLWRDRISLAWDFTISLKLPDSTWDISSLTYQVQTNSGMSKTDTSFVTTKNNGTIDISNFFPNQFVTSKTDFITKVKLSVSFNNGKTTEIVLEKQVISDTVYSGVFELSGQGGNSSDTSSQSTADSFIPKGFGIKRLGIADYLKVEQSTHAYVEGEVANIENIMAREYREKSTRRLRRSEVTETTSSDTEREQLTDTTTASRFEMQSEVAKILQESTDIGVSANTSFSYGNTFNMSIGASYANHRSKEDSMRQAVTQAQDVTSRALDRVVTKVHQERIEKIVEEFEENNSHGFDNRKGDKHVVGVYRWVDKLMKNQVWNYGKRLMFEFAVPQPAKIHTLATAALKNEKVIEKPLDPRKQDGILNLSDYSKLSDTTLKHWMAIYNVEIDEKPINNFSINKSFSGRDPSYKGEDNSETQIVNGNGEVIIPEGYIATEVRYLFNTYPHGFKGYHQAFISVAGIDSEWITGVDTTQKKGVISGLNVKEKLEFSFATGESPIIQGTLDVKCEITKELEIAWQQKTFNTIIEAYEDAMVEYNNKFAEEETKANNIKDSNPLFYRQIEQEVLKHNCIAYLTDDKSKTKNIGSKMYTGNQLLDFKVDRTDIDEYTSYAKFMEQAFEWDIMSYNLYPYYWGNKTEWGSMYVSEDADPLFRSFLRSGMARVVVTVRPGFEDAVQFYMATGRLWNGGEVPVIGDPMYLSIVDELKDIKGEAQGKPWITRIPTSLTILQAQNIGLEVKHALPFTTEDPLDFENPEEVITESNFYPSDDQMEAEKGKLVENIEINNDYLQLTNNDNPHQVIAQLSLDDLKTALE